MRGEDVVAISTISPVTGETLEVFRELDAGGIAERVDRSAAAFAEYRHRTFAERATWMRRLAEALDTDRRALATTMTTEMGKPIRQALAEVEKCARTCRWFAEHGPAMLAEEPAAEPPAGASAAWVRYDPLGPVLAVMPWNFPLWQVIRFAAPALMAGNTALLKHASNVPRCALAIEDAVARAGFPEGVFQTLLIGADAVAGVLGHDRVKAVSVTGSTQAGIAVARLAAARAIPCVLELGGSDPFVVTASADVEVAARAGASARCINSGQSCIAAKRFIVDRAVAAAFEGMFIEAMRALCVGDPMDEATEVGPLATPQILAETERFVADARATGATVLCGGARVDGPGWYYPPTVVGGVTPEMEMYHGEVFGPVAQLHVVDGIDEAVALANATPFGLGSSIWSRDGAEIDRFTAGVEAGSVFVNAPVASFPELPFGGIKASGYGRELAEPGIRAFCNLKTVFHGA